ncbi:MAG: hypothetical protein ABIN89_21475 [Chitinophagaceae bacterium]
MKKNLMGFLTLLLSSYSFAQTVTYSGCSSLGLGPSYTLNLQSTTNDGGTIRNTLASNPASGEATFGEAIIVRWNVALDRWEIFYNDDNFNPSRDFILYYSNFQSAPNPPGNSVANWQRSGEGGECADLASLTGSVQVVLPITLTAYEAVLQLNGQTNISWETGKEVNNDFFTIERSSDGIHFTSIGTVKG